MDKVDRLIAIVRQLREEMGGMTTGSSGPIAGFSAAADPKGPVAGNTYPMGVPIKKVIGLGPGSRKRWMKTDSNK